MRELKCWKKLFSYKKITFLKWITNEGRIETFIYVVVLWNMIRIKIELNYILNLKVLMVNDMS